MFPPEALKFLADLARNNRREWFQPRKDKFESTVRGPMLALVESVNAELARFAPDYITDPKKAVYRIYRDTRFSPDKTPYKTHQAALFTRRGGERRVNPGFYFSISAKEAAIAGGIYDPSPEQILAIRTWLAENHAAFRRTAKRPVKLMGPLHGDSLQRIPKGFPSDHPAADLIKLKQWVYYVTLDPQIAITPKFAAEIVKRFKVMLPVLEELNKAVSAARPKPMLADF